MKILILGGSGGLSGALASMAKESHEVWAVTRGQRPLCEGVTPLTADRDHEEEFRTTILNAKIEWDVVFDCICMNERHAIQDLDVLPRVSRRLIVISTDSVYDPRHKQTPQKEEGVFIHETGRPEECTYGGNKRRMEEVFLCSFAANASFAITIFRPGHIYGPGFLLGCFPEHSRQKELPDLIKSGAPLFFPACGIYITQPIFVYDLVETMLDCIHKKASFDEIFCVGGPEAVENRIYYEILGTLLGVPITIKELPLSGYGETHPDYQGHLCHRIYDLEKLRSAGIKQPQTTLEAGLKQHLQSLGH